MHIYIYIYIYIYYVSKLLLMQFTSFNVIEFRSVKTRHFYANKVDAI